MGSTPLSSAFVIKKTLDLYLQHHRKTELALQHLEEARLKHVEPSATTSDNYDGCSETKVTDEERRKRTLDNVSPSAVR